MEDIPMLANLLHFERGQTRWFDRARCRSEGDLNTFFPEPPQDATIAEKVRYASEVAEAVEICDVCPVKDLCLKDASDRGEVHGIWGGQNFYKTRRQQAAESREKVPA